MLACGRLVRYRTWSGIVGFFSFQYRTAEQSGITAVIYKFIYVYVCMLLVSRATKNKVHKNFR
jgi:hypothetical protein